MRKFSVAFALLIGAVPTVVGAQDKIRENDKEVTFQEPFVDEGTWTAKALSSAESISVTAATARLQQMNQDSRTAYAAGAAFPNETAGSDITPASGKTRVFVKKGLLASLRSRLIGLLGEDAFSRRFTLVGVAKSAADLDGEADVVIAALKRIGLDVTVRQNGIDGTVAIVADDPEAIRSAIARAGLSLPSGVAIEKGSPIIPAAQSIIWNGTTNLNNYYNNCTTSFPTMYLDSSNRWMKGLVTAQHCGNVNGYVDAFASGTYNYPSSVSARVLTGYSSFQYDVQVIKFVDQANMHIRNAFWDGTNLIVIRGATYTPYNAFLCAYGRYTGKKCGYVAFSTYRTSQGTFFKLYNNSGQRMASGGDSGGPVYMGNLIAGLTHGYGSDGSLYYSPAFIWRSVLPRMRLYCTC